LRNSGEGLSVIVANFDINEISMDISIIFVFQELVIGISYSAMLIETPVIGVNY